MRSFLIASVFVCGIALSAAHAQRQDIVQGNFCKSVTPGLKRTDALDCPSKHAWDLFLNLNHPAGDPKRGRGIPDMTKKIGTPGTVAVWETWRLALTEIYKEDGTRPPDNYDDLSLPGGPTTGKVPEAPKHVRIAQFQARAAGRPIPRFSPDEGIFKGAGGFGETRMNRVMYEFLLKEKLYNLNGQQQYARDVIAGKRETISFPPDSIEVKAAWIELTAAQIAAGEDRLYYVADYRQKKYGLIALHVLTKALPNWFWATFHHKHQEKGGLETPDVLGQPSELQGTVWENYVLGGTQIDFVDQTGAPTKLSDFHIEYGFTNSSCISCHARATASPNPGPDSRGLISGVRLGSPNKDEFRDPDGNVIFVPLDFVFSMPFRAGWEEERR